MGEVYHAIDPRLGRDVALKVLAEGSLEDAQGAERFAREARAASALNHPNVITIYEIGEFQNRRFIAMELVRGRTLRSLIGETHPNELISNLGAQVARGLAVAHAAGIVHRDIKPENIMVRDDGYVKLLDFGVARLLSGHKAQLSLTGSAATQTGVILGTLRYMSPEQGCADSVDTSTDLFSLGLVLYELCTGRHPFDAKSELGIISAIITFPATAPSRLNPAISVGLDGLIMSMLEKDPSRRPSATDVDALLSEFARSSEVIAGEAMALAERVTHPEARGFAPAFGAFIEQFRGNAPASFSYSEAVIAIARDRDIATTLAWGMVLHGWAVAHLGRIEEGIQEILESLASQKAAGSMIARTQFLAILADALIAGSRFEEARRAVNEGLEVAETTGDHYWDSELLRYKGELLLLTVNDVPGAESYLRQAIEHARACGAKSLELRAAMSLARLWKSEGRKDDARQTIVDIYGWFTEGFDTADLIEAKTLIDSLA